jgi:hypothetical protein
MLVTLRFGGYCWGRLIGGLGSRLRGNDGVSWVTAGVMVDMGAMGMMGAMVLEYSVDLLTQHFV